MKDTSCACNEEYWPSMRFEFNLDKMFLVQDMVPVAASFCDHGNETSVSTKGRECLKQLSDHKPLHKPHGVRQLHKQTPTFWRKIFNPDNREYP
jgi:hypothetical protein